MLPLNVSNYMSNTILVVLCGNCYPPKVESKVLTEWGIRSHCDTLEDLIAQW